MSRFVYLDHAAITPWRRSILRGFISHTKSMWYNPSSVYNFGFAAKNLEEMAREGVARALNVHSDELFLVSSGTEANNTAIQGILKAWLRSNSGIPHIITTKIEHSSVRDVCRNMHAEITELTVDAAGLISIDELQKAIKPNTVLVSIGYVNNEIGTIQHVSEISKAIRHTKKSTQTVYPYFHTDAAQALLTQDIQKHMHHFDCVSFDMSKIYGPRPAGILFVKRGTVIEPLMYGGGQQQGLRSGTTSAPLWYAASCAMMDAISGQEKFIKHTKELRSYLTHLLTASHIQYQIHAEMSSVPHIVSLGFKDVDANWLQQQLSAYGIAVSTKSACLKDEDGSYVLEAINSSYKNQTLRVSFGIDTSKRDLRYFVKKIQQAFQTQKKAQAFELR